MGNKKHTEPQDWERLSSKVILDHELLKITEDRVKLPNGLEVDYVRQAPTDVDAVIVIAINAQGKVLIQREYSYPPDKVMWQLPGGSMKAGEDAVTAGLRELAEESGYSAKKTTIIGSFYTNNRASDKQQYVILCTEVFRYELASDIDEFIQSFWLSKKEIEQHIRDGDFDNINLLAALNVWLYSKRH